MKNYFKVCLVLTAIFFLTASFAFAEEFKFTKTVIYPFDKNMDGGKIELSTANGFVKVIPVKDDNCKIEIKYTVKEKNSSSAEALANKATKISKTSSSLICEIKYQKENIKGLNPFSKEKDKEIGASITAYLPSKYLYAAELNSVNGAIYANGFNCFSLNAATVNGKIELDASAKKIRAATVNGAIDISLKTPVKDAAVSADTVNGAITIKTKKQKDAGIYLKASTVSGKIYADLENFKNNKNESFFGVANSVEGQTKNFDGAKYKTTIKAHSVNGKITISEE